ncbi:class I SAM-dependent methyltransferase [Castellaniella caeni]|uniref:class I SAM-dependent methyltransferase n=1 Tax=Castellaniella caeni TaxID=266123 RepID=UPI00082FBFA0|nr:class I SAM-dependent methyltransferase [Castellaniella caeni]
MLTGTSGLDYQAIKQRQHAVWASGDYAVIGTTLQIVGENLCEAVDLRAGSRVLDVAAGNGNATLAAARRFADVTSTDYVSEWLEQGRLRAAAERLPVAFQEADVEALPFADGSYDVVLSTFGVMFAPNQEQAAAELARVVVPGGRIGLANWTPGGFIGRLLKLVAQYATPVPGLKPSTRWGTAEGLQALFAGHALQLQARNFMFRYRSPEHWLEVFEACYGPTHKVLASLAPERQQALAQEILELLRGANQSGDASLVVPGEYLEVVVTTKAA